MYEVLYKFLVRYRKIHLPGIGTIVLQTLPAESRFVDQTFLPPRYSVALEKPRQTIAKEQSPEPHEGVLPSRKMFSWLADAYNITEREAIIRFNDFLFELKRQLDTGNKITWDRVGIFQKDHTGEITFHSDRSELAWLEPTIAKKVIRDNAEHTMLVGEREKTSVEMTEILLHPRALKEKHGYWWVWPLAVIISIFIFLGWYFSEHGVSGKATGNTHKVSSH